MVDNYFTSLDRQSHIKSHWIKPDRYRDLLANHSSKLIIQGSGLSYVGCSFGNDILSISTESFNRFLNFDPEAMTIQVESGVKLAQIYDFLFPRGFYLSVQPGYPQITVGGCIACDIHGKNQFRESLFSSIVEEIVLYHVDYGFQVISRTENSKLFEMTCGGFGLTGLIISAKLRISLIPCDSISVKNIGTDSLIETAKVLGDLSHQSDLLYSWNDFSKPERSLGEGYVIVGSFSKGLKRKSTCKADPIKYKDLFPKNKAYPVFNRFTVPLMNSFYGWYYRSIKREADISLSEFTYPVLNKTFYFNWFGKNGFVERQMLVPTSSFTSYSNEFEKLVRKYRPLIVLGTCKLFRGQQKYLNYTGNGISLSLDVVPSRSADQFHLALDELNVTFGVIDNLCKDSRVSADLARREYPEYSRFKADLHAYDPGRKYRSALSQRIEI